MGRGLQALGRRLSGVAVRSLYGRLVLVFLAILLVLGALTFWITQRSAEKYFLEFTQLLNAPIAMYMAENGGLEASTDIRRQGLEELAPHVMMINPSVEVYVLDAGGRIIGHTQSAEQMQLERVSMEPIHHFLSEQRAFPVLARARLQGSFRPASQNPKQRTATAGPRST